MEIYFNFLVFFYNLRKNKTCVYLFYHILKCFLKNLRKLLNSIDPLATHINFTIFE
jgi:hypothetical protein